MGVSGRRLSRAAVPTGQLGVVSGAALDVQRARRPQLGDPGGHIRRALAHFPDQEVTSRLPARYFVPGGTPGVVVACAKRSPPRWTCGNTVLTATWARYF